MSDTESKVYIPKAELAVILARFKADMSHLIEWFEQENPHDGQVTPDDVAKFIAFCGGGTTFAEIDNYLESRGFPWKGDMAMLIHNHSDLVLWSGMSDEYCDLMEDVFKLVEIRGSEWLVYAFDGRVLSIPTVGRRRPKGGYKKQRWAPVVFWEKGKVPGE